MNESCTKAKMLKRLIPNLLSPYSPRILPFPLLMVTELRAAMVNGRMLSEGWRAEVAFAVEGARSGSVAAVPLPAAFASAVSLAPGGTASASTLLLPSPRL